MMKQEALFRKLGNILNELNDQYQFLSQNPEQLSELELELFLANANFLADHIQIIKKLNLPFQAPLALTAPQVQEEPTIDEEIVDELKDVQQVEAITFANVEEKVEPSFQEKPIAIEEQAPVVVEEIPQAEEEIEEPQVVAEEVEEVTPLVEHEKELFRLEEEPTKTFEFILNSESYTDEDKFDFEEKTAEQLFDRPLSKEEELILEQKKKVKENLVRNPEDLEEDEIGPEPFLVHKEEQQELPKIIAEPVREEVPPVIETVSKVTIETTKVEVEVETAYKPTLNDILAGKNTGTRLNETSGNNITDLKSAINLNDKLLYIKDLFNGYNLAYAEAIDIANKMPNFDAADNFFQKNYAVKNNWADKQATVDKFYLLLNRRFKD